MLNWHELRMLMIFQVAMIFMVQNVFQIYSTFGQQLKSTDDYLQQAERVSKNDFYRFVSVLAHKTVFLLENKPTKNKAARPLHHSSQ